MSDKRVTLHWNYVDWVCTVQRVSHKVCQCQMIFYFNIVKCPANFFLFRVLNNHLEILYPYLGK